MSKKLLFKLCITFILCILVVNHGFCIENGPSEEALILNLSELDTDILKDLEENPEDWAGKLVFYAPAGYEMALNFTLSGDIASSASEEDIIKIRFAEPVYFYAPKEGEPLFSIDGKSWEKTAKLFSGIISFGCGVKKDEETEEDKNIFNLNFQVNLREE